MISNLKVLLVAERGESGEGWAALDDFEFLYDPYKVGIWQGPHWGLPNPLGKKY